jgi:RNA polymerase sigma factor (sigma-70 family)
VRDEALVEAALAGDRSAFAEVYDTYGPRLHAFCTRLLNEPHEAADAVQDTFVLAAQRLHQLQDPSKLRAWLYAIARNECTRRGRARARMVPTEEPTVTARPGEGAGDETGDAVSASEVASLLWAAADGLDDRDRILLELNVRHGLEGRELADAAGVPAGQISMATGRMRDRVERSLGALLVARKGRADCPGLRAVLSDWDGTFSVLVRKRVARHVDACDHCEARRKVLVAPLGSLAVLPFALPPAALRDQVLAAVSSALDGVGAAGGAGPGPGDGGAGGDASGQEPGDAGPNTGLAAAGSAAGPGAHDLPGLHEEWPGGFPPPLPDPGSDRRRRGIVVGIAAAVVLLLVVAVLVLGGSGDDPGTELVSGTAPSTAPVGPATTETGGSGGTAATTPRKGSTTTTPSTTTVPASTTTVPGQVGPGPGDPGGPTVPGTTPPLAFPSPTSPPITLAPNQPPSIGATTRSSPGTNMQTTCNPANSTRTVSVTVTDDRGVASVVLRWSGAAAGQRTMARVGTSNTWQATLGPFTAAGTVTYRAVTTDTSGVTATSPTASVAVDPCPG